MNRHATAQPQPQDLPTTSGAQPSPEHHQLLATATAWTAIENRVDGALSDHRGISFAEYRMLRRIRDAASGAASRVEIAQAVGRTPSGVTRALRPLEKLGFVETTKSERDARLALATLTPPGEELVDDATAILNDVLASNRGQLLGSLAAVLAGDRG